MLVEYALICMHSPSGSECRFNDASPSPLYCLFSHRSLSLTLSTFKIAFNFAKLMKKECNEIIFGFYVAIFLMLCFFWTLTSEWLLKIFQKGNNKNCRHTHTHMNPIRLFFSRNVVVKMKFYKKLIEPFTLW